MFSVAGNRRFEPELYAFRATPMGSSRASEGRNERGKRPALPDALSIIPPMIINSATRRLSRAAHTRFSISDFTEDDSVLPVAVELLPGAPVFGMGCNSSPRAGSPSPGV